MAFTGFSFQNIFGEIIKNKESGRQTVVVYAAPLILYCAAADAIIIAQPNIKKEKETSRVSVTCWRHLATGGQSRGAWPFFSSPSIDPERDDYDTTRHTHMSL
jgi:hypothetical protein